MGDNMVDSATCWSKFQRKPAPKAILKIKTKSIIIYNYGFYSRCGMVIDNLIDDGEMGIF